MKRIAIITPFILPVPNVSGGAVEELITKLIDQNEQNRGFHIDLYTMDNEKINSDNYKNTDIIKIKKGSITSFADRFCDRMVRQFRCKKSYRLSDYILLDSFMRRNKSNVYDYVIFENMSSTYRIFKRYISRKSKVFFHVHNNMDCYRSIYDFRLMSASNVTVIAASQFLKKQIEKSINNIKCECLWNAVDCNKFSDNNKTEADTINKIKDKYKIPNKGYIFMYSGRIIPQKGVMELLQAFRQVRKTNDNCYLVIAGDSVANKRKETAYEMLINDIAGVTGHVIFTGKVLPDDMPQLYSCADTIVMPSVWEEPFGMVALEAMSMKKMLIAFDSGSISDITGREYPILIKNDQYRVKKLADSMQEVINISDEEVSKRLDIADKRMKEHEEFNDKYYLKNLLKIMDSVSN